MHAVTLASLALAPILGANAAARMWNVGQGVSTTAGLIKGHASVRAPGVSEYLGIPFAEPPINNLRWQKPFKYRARGPISADKFGASCIPKFAGKAEDSTPVSNKTDAFSVLSQAGATYAEDCLTLNIWTKPQTGERNKAVLVWFYGGGFTSGNTASPTYHGAKFAGDQDVVLVTVNYRLNIFGFPGAPGLPDTNLGLLDQRLATEWVRDNIASFGGDPRRITIFGESAGAASVDFYSYAWVDDPIVQGFIPESGTAFMKSLTPRNSTKDWYRVSRRVGCGGRFDGAATVDCMRNKPWKLIVDAIPSKGLFSSFLPHPDGKVVFDDYEARAKAGKFIRKPILVGNNNNEAGLFTLLAQASGAPADPEGAFKTNLAFTCGAALAAKSRRDIGVKAWRYRFYGAFPNTSLGPKTGAVHGSEIAVVFGNTENVSSLSDTNEEKQLSRIMQTAWAAFAKNPEFGLSNIGWPVYETDRKTLVRLGYDNRGRATFVRPDDVDQNCDLWKNDYAPEPVSTQPDWEDLADEAPLSVFGPDGSPPTAFTPSGSGSSSPFSPEDDPTPTEPVTLTPA